MEENNTENSINQSNSQAQGQINSPTTQSILPNSTAVLVLGILSIVFCWCIGIVGLTLGIIALVLANKGNRVYVSNQNQYTVASYNNLKAGKICAIIGTILSGLYLLYYIFLVCFIGAIATSMPWDMLNK